jgi:hypothetical protein
MDGSPKFHSPKEMTRNLASKPSMEEDDFTLDGTWSVVGEGSGIRW